MKKGEKGRMLLERDPAPEHWGRQSLVSDGSRAPDGPLGTRLINVWRTSPTPGGGVEAREILSLCTSRSARTWVKRISRLVLV